MNQNQTLFQVSIFWRRGLKLLAPLFLASCIRSTDEKSPPSIMSSTISTLPKAVVESTAPAFDIKSPQEVQTLPFVETSKKIKKWHPPQKTSEAVPIAESSPSTFAPEVSPLVEMPQCQNVNNLLSFWLGFGVNNLIFEQSSSLETESGHFSVQTLGTLSMGAGLNFSPAAHLEFQYHQIQGRIPTQGSTTLDSRELIQKSWGVEYHHKVYFTEQSSYEMTVGVRDHHVPLLSTDQVRSLVNVFDLQFVNAIVGVRYSRWIAPTYEVELKLNYEILVSSHLSAPIAARISPKVMIEGTAGLRRRFSNGMTAGLFVVGKSLGYDYELTREGSTVSGAQQLRDATIEVRVGWEF